MADQFYSLESSLKYISVEGKGTLQSLQNKIGANNIEKLQQVGLVLC